MQNRDWKFERSSKVSRTRTNTTWTRSNLESRSLPRAEFPCLASFPRHGNSTDLGRSPFLSLRTHHAPLRYLLAPAPLRNISLTTRPPRASQQTPGLPVNLKIALRIRPVIKVHRHPRHKGIRRHHIPQIYRDHIRHQKIDILQRINLPTPRALHRVPRWLVAHFTCTFHNRRPHSTAKS
jgi:hypothetical protein